MDHPRCIVCTPDVRDCDPGADHAYDMLILSFCIGPARFYIDARRVSQVVPRVPLRALPLAEPYIAGLLDHHGSVVAVVDLAARLFRTACTSCLSTRIIIVRIQHEGREVPLGLIAEQVTELCQVDVPTDTRATHRDSAHDCVGRMIRVGDDLAQSLEIDRVLPELVRRQILDHVLM
jgi:chemotaxis-related protein WspB